MNSCALAYCRQGMAAEQAGRVEEAIALYRHALKLDPGFVVAHNFLIFAMHYSPNYTAADILEEVKRWALAHAPASAIWCERPVKRVGYVGPLYSHAVGRFLLPLIEHSTLETYCYSTSNHVDQVRDAIRQAATGWRFVEDLSDEALVNQVRADRIDVLVDLIAHGDRSRLLMFARKPAPVTVTHLAYPSTTGVVDYRLTDRYLDTHPCTEQSLYLPSYWCFRPVPGTPPVAPLPEGITFGALHHLPKVSAPVLEAWKRILQELPDARLVMHAPPGRRREQLAARLGERVRFVDRMPLLDYLRLYDQVHVALDTWPYAGGTTTCDALWQGVPVVSLAGRTGVGRGGLSILSHIGLPELVAHDTDSYVTKAVQLAKDRDRLNRLRLTMRERMQASVLMDEVGYARSVEAAYLKMCNS